MFRYAKTFHKLCVTVCHCNDFKNNINRFDISYKKKKKKKKKRTASKLYQYP